MIGVIAKAEERKVVRELFELFKTPWEFHQPGKAYDIIISSEPESEVATKLCMIFSSSFGEHDRKLGVQHETLRGNCTIDLNGHTVPIYGKIAIFSSHFNPIARIRETAEVAGVAVATPDQRLLRLGYDLFNEVRFLLTTGQPPEHALIPTLEIHIAFLRKSILDAGLPLIEIPPVPRGFDFMVCLTHDVDFVSIRQHRYDHTMWGFLYRAVIGCLFAFLGGRVQFYRLLRNWLAALSLPLVHLGLARDFWLQFDNYRKIETTAPSTFFLVPFKNHCGEVLNAKCDQKRATRYDIDDVGETAKSLIEEGCEVGVHGIDAWHNAGLGQMERRRISDVTGEARVGVRMHWLYFDSNSPRELETAGFYYDSTSGYNDAVGYRAGTTQVFRPLSATQLFELPVHLQDTAMFYPKQMALSEAEAWNCCLHTVDNCELYGGVLTINWHLRSLAPERLWGDFYVKLVSELKARRAWFGTATQTVAWFESRRSVTFNNVSFEKDGVRLKLDANGTSHESDLTLRVHLPSHNGAYKLNDHREFMDIPWEGEESLEIPLAKTTEAAHG